MRLYTTHLRRDRAPLLVREGFSGAAFWFGALWLAAGRAWVAAGLTMAAFLLTLAICRWSGTAAPLAGLAVLQGLLCPDLLRWSLDQRGFARGPVVTGTGVDQALARLLDARPELIPRVV